MYTKEVIAFARIDDYTETKVVIFFILNAPFNQMHFTNSGSFTE